MEHIECSVYDKSDIKDYLTRLKMFYQSLPDEKKGKFTMKKYNIDRIDQLLDVIDGKVISDYGLQKSSYKQDLSNRRKYYDAEEAREKYLNSKKR